MSLPTEKQMFTTPNSHYLYCEAHRPREWIVVWVSMGARCFPCIEEEKRREMRKELELEEG